MLSPDLSAIKVPRNQTAAMQLLQLYVQSGHYYWTSGVVLRSKLERFIEKLSCFRIGRDAPGRAYDKSKKLASTHLVLLDAPGESLTWILVSTRGRCGLSDPAAPALGVVKDTRLAGQHLLLKHYELLHMEKRVKRRRLAKFKQARDGRLQDVAEERTEAVTVTTWTWRLTPARVREHEALIVAFAKQRDEAGFAAELQALAMMPLFSGIRGQVLKLYGEAKKLSSKFKLDPPTVPNLPYLVKLPVYATPPTTIADLQGSAQNLDRRVR